MSAPRQPALAAADSVLAHEIEAIRRLATDAHDQTCARGDLCSARDWHIANDFLRTAREQRIAELHASVSAALVAFDTLKKELLP